MADKPYQEEAWLRREYCEKKRTVSDIAGEFDMTTTGITHWMDKHDIERRGQRESQRPDKPYTNPEWLREKYVQEERSMSDIGDECGVTAATILKWLRRHDIDTRTSNTHQMKAPAGFSTLPRGYELVTSKLNGDVSRAYVHQLVAIANGANPEHIFSDGDYHCHHKNGVKWDNRAGNIEVLTKSEHQSLHYEDREKTPTGEVI